MFEPQALKTAGGVAFSSPRPLKQQKGLHVPAPGLQNIRRVALSNPRASNRKRGCTFQQQGLQNSRRGYIFQPQAFKTAGGVPLSSPRA